jgi:serine/threonine-protein kinase
MVTNDLGACEWFVWDLRRSSLIDRGQLDQIVGEFLKRNPRAEAPALAEYLVQQGTLTLFQAERILNGKTQGLVLGPYVLSDSIGQGSMGQVYKSTSKNDDNWYAVKVLPRRSMWNVRLARRQVRSFSQFQHPAVVPFVDVGTAGGLHYLVWPLVEGHSLEAAVNQQGKLPVGQAAHIGVQVAQGLNVAHQNNLFHGLVKPSNLMIGPDGQTRILDFGIGSLLVENEGESLVDTMSTANTLTSGLDCASPESILEPSNRTPAGDQYSLGCVLYYCLTGHVPFPEGSAVEKMMAHQSKEPMAIKEYASDVPDGFVEVVQRLMAKKPEDRYSGCDEVVEALEPFLGDYSHPAAEPLLVGASASNSGRSFAAPPQSRGGSGGGRPSHSGSKGRMNGLPPAPANLPTGPIPGPTPIGGGRPPIPRASFVGGMNGIAMPAMTPAPISPIKSSSPMFPARGTFNFDEVPLTPAMPQSPSGRMPEPPPFADPSRQSVPGGWSRTWTMIIVPPSERWESSPPPCC